MHQTLHCVNDATSRRRRLRPPRLESELESAPQSQPLGEVIESREDGDEEEEYEMNSVVGFSMGFGATHRRGTRPCARDLVAECRRCGTVVCRVSSLFFLLQIFDEKLCFY